MAVIEFGAVAGKWSEAAKWVGGVKPGEGDDVVFSATSASCTVTEVARCRSFNAELYKATLTQESEIRIGTTTSNGGVCLVMGAGMTLNNTNGSLTFVSTSGVKEKITTAGKEFKTLHFELGKYEQMDDASAGNGGFEWGNCEYITNNHALKASTFRCNGTTNEINLGSSIISGPFLRWQFLNTYKSLISSGATLKSESLGLAYECSGAQTWKAIISKEGGITWINGATSTTTAETVEIGAKSETFSTSGLELAGGFTLVVTKEFKVNGVKDASYVGLKSSSVANAKLKLEAGITFTPEFLEFTRMTIEGGATINEANHSFDWGGNEGLTFKHNSLVATATSILWGETTSWVGGHLPTNCDDVVLASTSGNITVQGGTIRSYLRSLDATNYKNSLRIETELQFAGATAPASGIVAKFGVEMKFLGGAHLIFRAPLFAPSEPLKIVTEGASIGLPFYFEGIGKYELQDSFKYEGSNQSFVVRGESELKTNNQTLTIGKFEQEGPLSKVVLGSSTVICTSTATPVFVAKGFITPGTSKIEITGVGENEKEFETNSNAPLYDIVIASANVWFRSSVECHNLTLNTAGLALIKSSITKFNNTPFTITNELKHNGSEGSFVFFESRELTQVSPLHLPGAYSTDYIIIKGIKAEGPGVPFNAGLHSLDRGRNINWGFPSERYGSIPASVGPSVY